MKKITLPLVISALVATSAFAATGDTSTGTVTFGGYVPGFVANDGFIVTGLGGDQSPDAYSGALNINADGTFVAMAPVTLEGHLYEDTDSDAIPDSVGALQAADWEVANVNVYNASFNEVAGDVTVTDKISGTTLTASEFATTALSSGAEKINLTIANTKAVADPSAIAGQELTIGVDILATSN